MSEQEDTQPIDVSELLGLDDAEVEDARKRLPAPALVRAVVVAAIPLVSGLIGVQLNQAWIEPALATYSFVGPLVLGYWIHRHTKRSS